MRLRPMLVEVFSIDWSESQFNDIGRRNIERYGADGRHLLFEEPSWQVFPRLLTAGQQLDFVFINGWKTFDYLVYELFIINRMLASAEQSGSTTATYPPSVKPLPS